MGALGAMGTAARPAVQPMTEILLTPGERRNILVAIATALGDLGPEAKSALPALQQAAATRSVGPAAQEAILRIEGKPVPTWF